MASELMKQLEDKRIELQMSKSEMAKALGISLIYYSGIVNGVRPYKGHSVELNYKIKTMLNCNWETFMRWLKADEDNKPVRTSETDR